MIIQDKKKYFDYIKNTEEKVNNWYKSLNSNLVSETSKKDIDSLRSQIFGKLIVLNLKLDTNTLINQTDWIQYQQDVDALCKQLSDKINFAITQNKANSAER